MFRLGVEDIVAASLRYSRQSAHLSGFRKAIAPGNVWQPSATVYGVFADDWKLKL